MLSEQIGRVRTIEELPNGKVRVTVRPEAEKGGHMYTFETDSPDEAFRPSEAVTVTVTRGGEVEAEQ